MFTFICPGPQVFWAMPPFPETQLCSVSMQVKDGFPVYLFHPSLWNENWCWSPTLSSCLQTLTPLSFIKLLPMSFVTVLLLSQTFLLKLRWKWTPFCLTCRIPITILWIWVIPPREEDSLAFQAQTPYFAWLLMQFSCNVARESERSEASKDWARIKPGQLFYFLEHLLYATHCLTSSPAILLAYSWKS